MQNKKMVYSTPIVEVIDVKVEKGFATSYESNYFDPNGWENGNTNNWLY